MSANPYLPNPFLSPDQETEEGIAVVSVLTEEEAEWPRGFDPDHFLVELDLPVFLSKLFDTYRR